MAEVKAESKTDAAPKSKKKLLIFAVIGVLIFVLIAVGALAFFLLKSPADGSADEATAEAAAQGEVKKKEKKEKKDPDAKPVFAKLQDQPFTVNLSGEAESVLQVEIMVELAEEADKEKIIAVQPKILDAVNRLLRAKTLEEVKTAKGQEELARLIREKINEILEVEAKDEGVLSVNFTKYFYQ